MVGSKHARGAPPVRLKAIEAIPASDIEKRLSRHPIPKVNRSLRAEHLQRGVAIAENAIPKINLVVPRKAIDLAL